MTLPEIIDNAASNSEFIPGMSSNELFYGTSTNDRLTDVIADVAEAVLDKADSDHTHTGYAAANHEHTGYAAADHTHTGYAASTHSHTAASIGAAAADHSHTGYAAAEHSHDYAASTHSHTPASIGAAAADHSHTGYAASTHTHTPVSIGAAPTSHASSTTTYGVSTDSNYGHAKASGTTPKAPGEAAVGSETTAFARGDHVHPFQFVEKGVTTAGTGAAYTATVDGITALTTGVAFLMIPHVVSTVVNPTLNVNGLGAKNIRRRVSNSTVTTVAASAANWLGANKPVRVIYDGTYWIAEFDRPNATDIYGTVAIANGGTGATSAAAALTNLGAFPAAGGTIGGDTNVNGVLKVNGQQAIYYAASTASQTIGTGNATGGTTIACGSSANVNINGANVKMPNALPKTSNTYYCGNSTLRWKGIYSNSEVNVASDKRLKRDIATMDDAALAAFIEKLNVVSFNYTDDPAEAKSRIGLIAQDVQQADAALAKFFVEEDEEGMLGMTPADLVFPLIAAVQQLSQRVAELEGK